MKKLIPFLCLLFVTACGAEEKSEGEAEKNEGTAQRPITKIFIDESLASAQGNDKVCSYLDQMKDESRQMQAAVQGFTARDVRALPKAARQVLDFEAVLVSAEADEKTCALAVLLNCQTRNINAHCGAEDTSISLNALIDRACEKHPELCNADQWFNGDYKAADLVCETMSDLQTLLVDFEDSLEKIVSKNRSLRSNRNPSAIAFRNYAETVSDTRDRLEFVQHFANKTSLACLKRIAKIYATEISDKDEEVIRK